MKVEAGVDSVELVVGSAGMMEMAVVEKEMETWATEVASEVAVAVRASRCKCRHLSRY